jgi:hypothetical protein
LVRTPRRADLLAAFTVQEEVGLRRQCGSPPDPAGRLCPGCHPANDLPDWEGSENSRYNTRLGAGPAIYIADGATLSDPRLVRLLSNGRASAPYRSASQGPLAALTRLDPQAPGRHPSVSLSVPTRYLHTPLAGSPCGLNCLGLIRLSGPNTPALLDYDANKHSHLHRNLGLHESSQKLVETNSPLGTEPDPRRDQRRSGTWPMRCVDAWAI